MIEDKPTVNLDGVSYILEDMSDNAKQYIAQIQNITTQVQELQSRLQQAEVARAGFVDMLRREVKQDVE